MWNKGGVAPDQMEDSHRGGSRVRKEYNANE